MQIPVLIESIANNGYRARSGEPIALTAEGATSEDAVRNLEILLREKLVTGARLVELEVSTAENPWVTHAGMFKDHPQFDDVVAIMAQQRKEVESDPNYL